MTRAEAAGGGKKLPVVGILIACAAGAACVILIIAFTVSRRRAIALPSSDNLDAAIASDQRALDQNPDDLKALTDMGLRYYLKGPDSYPEAINDLEDALNLGALDARIFYCLGIMYQNLGLYSFSLEEYQRYLRNDPNDEHIALLAAKLLYQSGRFSEAAGEYQRLQGLDPKNPIVIENLALSVWKNGSPQDALDVLNRMEGLGPAAAGRAAFDAAQINYGLKKFDAAAVELAKAQNAVGAAPQDVPAADFDRLLARTNQKLGRLQEAEDAWERLLLVAPKDGEAARSARRLKRLAKPRVGRAKT